ncbi:MAG: Mov34/MPN/PAD-1 family protein [Limnochordia bacterium]
MSNLMISRTLLNEMVTHCRRELPHEACGLLAGKGTRVTVVMPMPNAAVDPEHHYVVDSVAQRQAFRLMDDKKWEFVGVYHSHPRGAAVPSTTDIRQSLYCHVVHVIVSLRWSDAVVRAYRLIRESERYVRVGVDIALPSSASRTRPPRTRTLRRSQAGDTLDANRWRDWHVDGRR